MRGRGHLTAWTAERLSAGAESPRPLPVGGSNVTFPMRSAVDTSRFGVMGHQKSTRSAMAISSQLDRAQVQGVPINDEPVKSALTKSGTGAGGLGSNSPPVERT